MKPLFLRAKEKGSLSSVTFFYFYNGADEKNTTCVKSALSVTNRLPNVIVHMHEKNMYKSTPGLYVSQTWNNQERLQHAIGKLEYCIHLMLQKCKIQFFDRVTLVSYAATESKGKKKFQKEFVYRTQRLKKQPKLSKFFLNYFHACQEA